MKKCIMGDNVERIKYGAFGNCHVKNVRLSRALRYIGHSAFCGCDSIECLFIPPNVGKIERFAFSLCTNMKILILPADIELNQIGDEIVYECYALHVQYRRSRESDLRVHEWLKHRYDHLPLLRLCADPDVTAATIQQFTQDHGTAAFYQTDNDHGLTPLHILTRYNGFASDDAIISCFGANPAALFIRDGEGLTPLEHLWNVSRVDMIVHFMQDLCVNYQRTNHEDFGDDDHGL